MTTQTTKATGGIGGLPMRDSLGGRAWLSGLDSTTLSQPVKSEPGYLAALRLAVEIAGSEGDRAGYLLGRRLLLLTQSALYQAGEVER